MKLPSHKHKSMDLEKALKTQRELNAIICNQCHGIDTKEVAKMGYPDRPTVTAFVCYDPKCISYGLLQVPENEIAEMENCSVHGRKK